MNCQDWIEKMKDYPCYTPCPPFYDMCNRIGHPTGEFDCDKCLQENQLKDYIE